MTVLFQLCEECSGRKTKIVPCGVCKSIGNCTWCRNTREVHFKCEKCLGVGYILTKAGEILEEIFEARRDFINESKRID